MTGGGDLKVSVIIPAYRRAGIVAETLDSVFAQTHRPVELIVVDDGSPDETPAAVRAWLAEHPDDPAAGWSARLIEQPNAGAPAARNRGFRESSGELIQFFDSDDVMHPERLARHAAAFAADPSLDLTWSESGRFAGSPPPPGEWGTAGPFRNNVDEQTLPAVVNRFTLDTRGPVLRRRLCERVGPWHEPAACWQDWEYGVRLLLADPVRAKVPGVLALERVHDRGRISVPAFVWERSQDTCEWVETRLRAAVEEHAHPEAPAALAALADVYFSVALKALREGLPGVARRAVRRGTAVAGTGRRRRRLAVLGGLARLPAAAGRPLAAALGGAAT